MVVRSRYLIADGTVLRNSGGQYSMTDTRLTKTTADKGAEQDPEGHFGKAISVQ